MDQSRTFTKLLRALQFRKHIKELTSACKRINKDGCYEFVTSDKKSVRRSKKKRSKSSIWYQTIDKHEEPLENMNNYEQLSHATPTSPANLSMIISQSYKPLYAKSTQFNKNTIAVTKDTIVKALYTISNWVFIEIPETGQTGFIPIYCIHSHESPSHNNISLLNVSTHDSHQSMTNNRSSNMSTPPTGRFISSIGPRISSRAATFTRQKIKEESVLSRQISNISLHLDDHDAYGTLNLTPCKNLSFNEPIKFHSKNRLRVIENYQKQFIGDISVLESEVVTFVNTNDDSNNDWKLVRRGDGKQGYIPKHIVILDRNFT